MDGAGYAVIAVFEGHAGYILCEGDPDGPVLWLLRAVGVVPIMRGVGVATILTRG